MSEEDVIGTRNMYIALGYKNLCRDIMSIPVRPTEKGASALRLKTSRKATWVGFCLNPETIRIRLNGNKQATTYHCSFWEVVPIDPPHLGREVRQ
jgi:hypothetical protein